MEEAQMSVNIVSKLEFNYSFQTFFYTNKFQINDSYNIQPIYF